MSEKSDEVVHDEYIFTQIPVNPDLAEFFKDINIRIIYRGYTKEEYDRMRFSEFIPQRCDAIQLGSLSGAENQCRHIYGHKGEHGFERPIV